MQIVLGRPSRIETWSGGGLDKQIHISTGRSGFLVRYDPI